jgi:CDP-diacylglycerol--glycerol-3-phosphate 3-phosphatidyltransferase
MKYNFATVLTLSRLLAIPLVVVFYWLPFALTHEVSALLFIYACITDWLDGYVARNYAQMSRFGQFLDPVADKLLVAMVLVILLGNLKGDWLIWPAAIIIGREIVISSVREWMAEVGKRTSVAVNQVGKLKTVLQMSALGTLLWYQPDGMGFSIGAELWVYQLGLGLLYVAPFNNRLASPMYIKITLPSKLKPVFA